MDDTTIDNILARMQGALDHNQLQLLRHVLISEMTTYLTAQKQHGDVDDVDAFLSAKKVEGCSHRTLHYYESTLKAMCSAIDKPCTRISTDDLRAYLNGYAEKRHVGKVTMDNIRRILSSFFSWLEEEDYIVKNPMRRIHRVKTAAIAKRVLDDEQLETLRDGCDTKRDLAIVEMLASTGMRVGELVRLNIEHVDFNERECIVTGKGDKQRHVYFDARTKLHLKDYLDSRSDNNPALFVSLDKGASRLTIGAVEERVRSLGKSCGVGRVYPHLFRRTLATHAIDKGMPIEQVQRLLGHAKIDTTMHYAMVNQNNVKASHRRYLE